ncbi:hypothetical protein KM043_018236 [Ampulex compressa]|nr:hypothetical protein KM043_018236 [Ampulex compressa]
MFAYRGFKAESLDESVRQPRADQEARLRWGEFNATVGSSEEDSDLSHKSWVSLVTCQRAFLATTKVKVTTVHGRSQCGSALLHQGSQMSFSNETVDPSLTSMEPIERDYYATVLHEGLRQDPLGSNTAQVTVFGWVVFGPFCLDKPAGEACRVQSHCVSLHTQNPFRDEVNFELSRFWQLDEVRVESVPLSEVVHVHFMSVHSRRTDGRVACTEPYVCYQDSVQRHMYCESILPHHLVIKEDAHGFKVCVVFNASNCISNSTALNDDLLVGPKL